MIASAFTKNQLLTMRPIIRNEKETLHNHILDAVNKKDFNAATRLADSLNELQQCYIAINRQLMAMGDI